MSKPTCNINARMDITELATCLEYFRGQGLKLSSRSLLLRECVSLLCQVLVSNGLVERVTSAEAAFELITAEIGSPAGRSSGNLARAIKIERLSDKDVQRALKELEKKDNHI